MVKNQGATAEDAIKAYRFSNGSLPNAVADLKEGNEGAYRVRFKDNKKGWDTTYPAAELLPDGSLVCTTYGHWEKGESPYILSFKFHIKTLDEKAKKIKKFGQTTIHNEMGKNMFIFDPDNSKMIQKKIED